MRTHTHTLPSLVSVVCVYRCLGLFAWDQENYLGGLILGEEIIFPLQLVITSWKEFIYLWTKHKTLSLWKLLPCGDNLYLFKFFLW